MYIVHAMKPEMMLTEGQQNRRHERELLLGLMFGLQQVLIQNEYIISEKTDWTKVDTHTHTHKVDTHTHTHTQSGHTYTHTHFKVSNEVKNKWSMLVMQSL